MGRRTSDPKWTPELTVDRITNILSAVKRTPAQFAPLVGVSRQTVYNWLSGTSVPGPDVRAALQRLESKLNLKL